MAASGPAWSDSKGGGAGDNAKAFMKAMIRVGLGYGFSTVDHVEPGTVGDFNTPRSLWQEMDFLLPLSIHFGMRETWDDSANVNFHGQGIKPAELYMTAFNLGAKFTLPFWIIQPWLGGGVTGGFLAVSDPTNRNTTNWMVAFDKETKAIRGAYWQAGLDIMFGAGFGVRIGMLQEKIRTDRFNNLQNTAMEFEHTMFMLGGAGSVK